LVLRRRRHGDVAGNLPDRTIVDIMGAGALEPGIFGNAGATALLDLLDQVEIDAVLVDHIAVGIRAGDDLAAEGLDLLHGVDGNIARAGNDDALALEVEAARRQHAGDEIGRPVAGRLLARARTAIIQRLAGEDTGLVAIGQPLVLAEHVADLAHADADIAGRHVGIFAEVPVQLGHEGLAETHDLAIGAAARIEIRAALAAADRQAGQGILEG